MKKMRTRALFGALAAAAILGGSAFTASNTMPSQTKAGTGSVTVTGYTATFIDYNLNTTDPTTIDSVDITITGQITASSNAKLQLASAGAWYDCTQGTFDSANNETPLNCTTTGAAVSSANNVTLVISD